MFVDAVEEPSAQPGRDQCQARIAGEIRRGLDLLVALEKFRTALLVPLTWSPIPWKSDARPLGVHVSYHRFPQGYGRLPNVNQQVARAALHENRERTFLHASSRVMDSTMSDSPPDPFAFEPVPSASNRHDGWTPER